MKIPFVDLHAQYRAIQPEIDAAIAAVIAETAFISGKYAETFEASFAAWLGHGQCIGCGNGTDAIEIMLQAMGIGHGDEVLVPACTWISTAEAVSSQGATPVFVDCHPDYYTLDTRRLEEKLTDRTKAIIPVHLYGLAADMDDVMAFAHRNQLYVIEDCAQAHGATWNGQKVGTFGHGATFSFYPGKNLGAYGDAGCMVTADETLARELRMIANHGQLTKHEHLRIGRNSRLDGMQAAILSAKLPYLDGWTQARQQHAATFTRLLEGLPIQVPQIPALATHVFHLYVIQVDERDALMDFLKEKGISTAIHYPQPLPFTDIYQELGNHSLADFPVAAQARDRMLSLPLFPELSKAQVDYVCGAIRSFFGA